MIRAYFCGLLCSACAAISLISHGSDAATAVYVAAGLLITARIGIVRHFECRA